MEILLPRRFDRDTLSGFFDSLDESRDIPDVTINFGTLTYSYPTAMLVAGSKLREWVTYRYSRGLRSISAGVQPSITVHSYLMHLGFFDFIHLGGGNRVGEAGGSTRYLPIRKIEIHPFDPSRESLADWHGEISDQARRLACVLTGSLDSSEELQAYTYSIREILRNVFEHSGSQECYICGQRWYNGRAEIAIIDEGRGIRSSIEEAFDVETDLEAINIALRPGASRTNVLEKSKNIYDNSGFGLYVLSNLASSFGWFAIGSGSSRVIGYDRTVRMQEPFSFRGTFFGLRLNKRPHNFRGVLEDIIDVGEQEAEMTGIRRRASGLSRHV